MNQITRIECDLDHPNLWICVCHSRFYLIYLTLVLHGIGTLMPWNMFITAKEVRTEQEIVHIKVQAISVEVTYAT